MAVRLVGSDPTFGRESPVRDYWLAHCAGFRVLDGDRVVGVVEGVYGDGVAHVDELAVRTRWGRGPRRVPAELVETIVPARQLVVLAAPGPEPAAAPQQPRPREPRLAAASAYARRLRAHVARAAGEGRRLGAAALAWLVAAAVAAASWLAPRSLALDRALLRRARRGAAAAAAEWRRLHRVGAPIAREALARGGENARVSAARAAAAARAQAASSRAALAARASRPAGGPRRPVRRARAASRRPPGPPPR